MPGGASTYMVGESTNHPLADCPIAATASLPVHVPNGSGQSGFVTGTATEYMPSVRVAFLPPAGTNKVPS